MERCASRSIHREISIFSLTVGDINASKLIQIIEMARWDTIVRKPIQFLIWPNWTQIFSS